MPTKTSKTSTSKTSKTFVNLTNVNGEKYILTKTKLREGYRASNPYSLNLANLKLKGTNTVRFTYGLMAVDYYGSPLTANISTDRKTYIEIGCQRFEGVNARKIFRAVARVAKVTARKARAAAAGA